jgi:CheY-like chemotaxis protein
MKSETRRQPQSTRRIAFVGEVLETFAVRVVHKKHQNQPEAAMNSNFAKTETGTHWMIVDDNEDFLSLMPALVGRSSGAAIECFNSPQTALAAFRAAPEKFRLVITDLEMSDMNGIEFCRQLHELSLAQKVLLLTGSEVLTDEQAAQNGFCGMLHKPFRFASLEQALTDAGVLKIPAEKNVEICCLNVGLRSPSVD